MSNTTPTNPPTSSPTSSPTTSPTLSIDGDRKNIDDQINSSNDFFTDFQNSSNPDSRNNLDNLQNDPGSIDQLTSSFLNNDLFISCINDLLKSDKNDDDDMINYLKKNTLVDYKDEHFEYIKNKIDKFLSLDPSDYQNCLNKLSNSKETICKGGIISFSLYFADNIISFFGNKIDLENMQKGTTEYQNFLRLYDLFVNNIQKIIKKTIDISKYFEFSKCDDTSTLTFISQVFYDKLLTNSSVVEYKLFDKVDLKFSIFDKLNNTFIGQIILLICFTFILWKIINMFN